MPAGTDTRRSDAREDLLAHLEESGARVRRRPAPPRVVSFGSTGDEYAALVDAAALVDSTDRVLFRVWGDRATEMLDGLLTNRLESGAGRAVYSFMLDPKGRPVAELRALCVREDEYWLDMPDACGESAASHMEKYLPPRFARFERLAHRFRLALVGPQAPEVLAGLETGVETRELEPLQAGRGEFAGGEVLVVSRERAEGPGADFYVGDESLSPAWDALASAARDFGGRPAGAEAYDIWRVERGIPVYGQDITQGNLPQETGQEERAVSFDKGCYTGQEVVIRIHHRGHVNRHLRGLSFETPPPSPPETGTELFDGDRAVGTVTSAVESPRLGPIALGYVRREVEPGSVLAAGSETGRGTRVERLPFTAE